MHGYRALLPISTPLSRAQKRIETCRTCSLSCFYYTPPLPSPLSLKNLVSVNTKCRNVFTGKLASREKWTCLGHAWIAAIDRSIDRWRNFQMKFSAKWKLNGGKERIFSLIVRFLFKFVDFYFRRRERTSIIQRRKIKSVKMARDNAGRKFKTVTSCV